MYNDFDLDITKYNYNDVINLFNISSNIDDEDFIKCKSVINEVKNNKLNTEIVNFFSTCYFILLCIKKYREFLIIKNKDYRLTNKDDEYIFNKILAFPNFKSYNNPLILINKIIDTNNNYNNNNDLNYDVHNIGGNDGNGGNGGNGGSDSNDGNNNINQSLIQLINEIKLNRVVNVFDNDIAKGSVNPIKRITQLVNLHFNSSFRENYYRSSPTNFRYNIPTGGVKNVVSMKLSSIEIPNSWFLFSGIIGNNKFIIEVTFCNKCSVHHIVVPDGNYDRETIINFLNEKYFVNSNDNILKNIEISIDTYTNRTYFKLSKFAPDDFVFSLHFVDKDQTNMLNTFGWIMGFRLARYLKIDDVLQSEGLFDGGGDRYVYITLNDYQYNYNENNIICFDSMSIDEKVLAKIPLFNGKFSLNINENNYNPLVKIRRYNAPVNINRIEIKLLDKFGNIIDLNNMDWSFSIEFEVLYENILSTHNNT